MPIESDDMAVHYPTALFTRTYIQPNVSAAVKMDTTCTNFSRFLKDSGDLSTTSFSLFPTFSDASTLFKKLENTTAAP